MQDDNHDERINKWLIAAALVDIKIMEAMSEYHSDRVAEALLNWRDGKPLIEKLHIQDKE